MKRLIASIVNLQPRADIDVLARPVVSTVDMREAVTEAIPVQRRQQHLSARAVSNEDLANWSLR